MEQGQIHTYQGQGRQRGGTRQTVLQALLVRQPIALCPVLPTRCVPCFETLYQPVPPGLSGQDKKLRPVRRRNHRVAHRSSFPSSFLGGIPQFQGFQYTFAINGPYRMAEMAARSGRYQTPPSSISYTVKAQALPLQAPAPYPPKAALSPYRLAGRYTDTPSGPHRARPCSRQCPQGPSADPHRPEGVGIGTELHAALGRGIGSRPFPDLHVEHPTPGHRLLAVLVASRNSQVQGRPGGSCAMLVVIRPFAPSSAKPAPASSGSGSWLHQAVVRVLLRGLQQRGGLMLWAYFMSKERGIIGAGLLELRKLHVLHAS